MEPLRPSDTSYLDWDAEKELIFSQHSQHHEDDDRILHGDDELFDTGTAKRKGAARVNSSLGVREALLLEDEENNVMHGESVNDQWQQAMQE
jgi:hypothetical protein